MNKICSKCSIDKSISEFNHRKGYAKYGVDGVCRECKNVKRRSTHDPIKASEENLRYRFKLTVAQRTEMEVKQNNLCAVCNKSETVLDFQTGKVKRLSVDHNHTTGEIRGLLCSQCNLGLGHLDDSFDLLLKAAKYLQLYENTL